MIGFFLRGMVLKYFPVSSATVMFFMGVFLGSRKADRTGESEGNKPSMWSGLIKPMIAMVGLVAVVIPTIAVVGWNGLKRLTQEKEEDGVLIVKPSVVKDVVKEDRELVEEDIKQVEIELGKQ